MIQWSLLIEDTLGVWVIGRLSFIQMLSDAVEPLNTEDTLGAWEVSFIGRLSFIQSLSDTVEPLNRGHTLSQL